MSSQNETIDISCPGNLIPINNKLVIVIKMAIFLLLTLQCGNAKSQNKNIEINHDKCTSFVSIQGSTNLNKFFFLQKLNKGEQNISFQNREGYIRLEIPSKNFEASNPLMYDDFISLIKAEKYPYISIRFLYKPYEQNNKDEQLNLIEYEIYITLAGHENKYKIPGVIHQCKNSATHIMGEIKINLKDFQLQAPSKFMGMVKVNNEVFVNFGLSMEQNLITKK